MARVDPARNDPCPCGSGRKYKHCCLARFDAARTAAYRLRTTCGRVTNLLLRFAADAWGGGLLLNAWDEFWNWEDVPDDIASTPEGDVMFVHWFLFGFVPDPHDEDLDPGWPTRPIGLEWLASTKDVADADRRWVEAACRSPLSVCVVERVDAGEGLDVRDVLTGKRFSLRDSAASRSLLPADLMFTRVVTLDGLSVPLGTAPLVIPPRWHTSIIDWRARLFPRRLMTRADLEDFDIEIRDMYFDIAANLLDPQPPQLRNTAGDELAFTTLTYEVLAPVDEIVKRLAPLATIDGDDHSTVTTGEGGRVASATIPWLKRGNRRHKSWANTELGTVRVETGHMVAEVNSSRRAERLKREIARRLKGTVVLRDTTVAGVEDLLRKARLGGAPTRTDRPPEQDEALLAVQNEFARRHWEEWLDTRVPALGNKTPRQAAGTPLGRERLEALLAQFDRDAPAADKPFLETVRRELGVSARLD